MLSTQTIHDHFNEYEGDIPHFYLDGNGVVTLGLGCQIWDASYASSLTMVKKVDNSMARAEEVANEYLNIQKLEPKRIPAYYNLRATLYMLSSERLKLFNGRVKAFQKLIKNEIVDLSDYPDAAGLVLLDMCFTLGVARLKQEFTKFLPLFVGKKFAQASKEVQRKDVQRSRNDWAEQTLLKLGDS